MCSLSCVIYNQLQLVFIISCVIFVVVLSSLSIEMEKADSWIESGIWIFAG